MFVSEDPAFGGNDAARYRSRLILNISQLVAPVNWSQLILLLSVIMAVVCLARVLFDY